MGLIVSVLYLAAARSFIDGHTHRMGHRVRIHDNQTLCVTRSASDGLDQAGLRAQETFLVSIQDRNQADLRQIQAFPEQIDTDQNIKLRHTQITDDLHALHCTNVRVHIAHLDACLLEVDRQILRHFFGKRCHQDPFVSCASGIDLTDQIIDLALDRPYIYNRIQ